MFRAGIGLFYENNIWNNQLFDRPARLSSGLFLLTQQLCSGGSPQTFTLPGTSTVINPANICGQPIGQVASAIAAIQGQYQAATAASGAASNPGFIGNTLTSTTNGTATDLFAPNYQTPRSVQMNFGLQHEFRPGLVLSADFVRNVETHTLLAIDVNHVGDARFFNLANAKTAIATTLANCGVATINMAISNCPDNPETGAAGYNQPATIADFASNGLDSGNFLCGGGPCPTAAFPGINPNLGTNQMLFPAGRAVYNGLQMKLVDNVAHPAHWIRNLNFQIAYSFSRYVSTSTDSDFINNAVDNNDPTHFICSTAWIANTSFRLAVSGDLPASFRVSIITHYYSPLPVTLYLPTSGNPGGIFSTDVTGDGSGDGSVIYPTGDLLPGTNIGAYGRSVNAGNINNTIQAYDQADARQPTPAGQVLLNNGLFTLNQLQGLGGVQPFIQPAPANQANMGWLKIFDVKLSWLYRVKDRVTLEPGASFYNVFNYANFDGANNPLSGILDGSVGSVNGTSGQQPASNRLGLGSGVFALGAPRAIEFLMKVSF